MRGLIDKDICDLHILVIDCLTTTGGTLKEIKNRIEKLGGKPVGFLVIIDRSMEGLKEIDGIPIYSLVTKGELVDAGIWEPEILIGDIASPSCTALDLINDNLYEICRFYDRVEEYNEIRKKFYQLIVNYGNRSIADEFVNFLINVIILSYNFLKRTVPQISELEGIEYLRYIAEVETLVSPISRLVIREILYVKEPTSKEESTLPLDLSLIHI